jgi:hypothetical protein
MAPHDPTGNYNLGPMRGVRDGVEIEVLIRKGEIWTAYPTNLGKNP